MTWKKTIIMILILTVLCFVVAAFIYIHKYIDEKQQSRDNSIACHPNREFLQTAANWTNIGEPTLANALYKIEVD